MGPFIHQIANWRRTRQTLTKYLGCIPASKWIITINMVHNPLTVLSGARGFMNSGGLTFRGQRRAWVLRTRLSFTFWRPQESIWMELTGLISPAIQQTTKDTKDFSTWRFWNRYIYLESFGGYLTFWVISYRAPITQRLFDIQLAPTGPVSRQVAVRQNGQLLLDLGLVFFLLAESGGAQLAAQRSEHSCPPCWAGLRESLHSKTLALLMKSNQYIQDCIGVLTCKWGMPQLMAITVRIWW